eukprot:gene17723-biopygen15932
MRSLNACPNTWHDARCISPSDHATVACGGQLWPFRAAPVHGSGALGSIAMVGWGTCMSHVFHVAFHLHRDAWYDAHRI